MHDWAKRQQAVYSGIGFGETKRSFAANEYRYRLALRYISEPPKTILDVGCCDGFLTEYLRQRRFVVVGMDLPKVIEKAKVLYPKCEFITCNLDTEESLYPNYHGYFDIVCALEIIEHMYYDAKFLQRMALYLKDGGLIILTTPATAEKIVDDHIRYYPLESLRKLCEYSGFEVIKLKKVGENHIAIGAKK
jgi:2-polyprenyl-3-methyl-5-hydroxy-6-metoxy-1,4-benzoquinol methylase